MTPTIRSVLFSTAIALLTIVGCVSSPPVSPDITKGQNNSADSGHVLLGFYSVNIDLSGMTAEIVPVRETLDHFNVTKFLFPPYCPDCLKIHVVGIDWGNLNVTAEVTVKNFTKGLTGYDIRGIVYTSSDFKLLNPYAYTGLYLPPGVVDPCGFRAYETDDPERKIGPGESSTETYIIGFPSGAKFVDLKYAVDASAPGHCLEPYEITGFDQEYLDPSVGATATVSVYVSDWQNDTTSVNIDLEILGGVNKKMAHGAGDLWTVEITNVYGLPTGMYPALITAADKVGWFNLYQWVEIEIGSVIDDDPPIWDNEIGITGAYPGMTGILAKFGTATDPSEPVTYNLYWANGPTLDFASANEVTGIEQSPYFLEDLDPGEYTLAVRASDSLGNETINENTLTVETGIHPNVYWTNGPDMPQARSRGGCFYK
ncbi:MAG: hypothetical protein ABIC40_03415, partial [bacterium]